MQRRLFIQLSAYTAAVLAVPLASGCGHSRIEIESRPDFFSHLVDGKTIIEAGRAYRAKHKSEDDQHKLTALLLSGSPANSNTGGNDLISLLESEVENDFKTGNTTVVKGWVLSVTEARQCALFSILQS